MYFMSLPFGMSADSSRIRLILRARISAIHHQTAHHFRLPQVIPSKLDVSTPTEESRRFARSILIGPSALQRPLTSVDTQVSRKSAVRRDTCPAMIVLTTSLYSVAVNRDRLIGSPVIDTWLDRHPHTMAGYLMPKRRVTSFLLLNVCWHRHLLRHPPRQRLISVRFALVELKIENVFCA